MLHCFRNIFVLMVITGLPVCAQDSASPTQLEFFETRIRPLLHSRCVRCHGQNERKGGLRLDSLEGLLHGGESGPAVVTGKPAESLLLEAVRYESSEMPPDKPLSKDDIADLATWVRNGAAWPMLNGKSIRLQGAVFTEEERSFWSLQPLTHPNPPPAADSWGRNEIDRFIAAKLKTAGLEAAPPADNDVLIRRLYFDLLGVPPSPEEISELKSEVSHQRWAELVDRLLADSRYGEHWARYWLDVVRYAESDGFRADFYRPEAWRFRDYVVNAFNDDKPYDRFIIEQLAGDEVAPEKAEALVATGFLRTFLYEYNQRDARTQWQDILNQVTDVTAEAFLGVSIGCARCHDHKFDPILQEDYYRLQACFGTMVPRDDIPAADHADRQRYDQQYEAWLSKGAEHRAELKRIHAPYLKKAAKSATEKFPEDVQVIMAKLPADRTPLELQLADLVNRQIQFDESRGKISDEDTKRIAELQKQILEVAGQARRVVHLHPDGVHRPVEQAAVLEVRPEPAVAHHLRVAGLIPPGHVHEDLAGRSPRGAPGGRWDLGVTHRSSLSICRSDLPGRRRVPPSPHSDSLSSRVASRNSASDSSSSSHGAGIPPDGSSARGPSTHSTGR